MENTYTLEGLSIKNIGNERISFTLQGQNNLRVSFIKDLSEALFPYSKMIVGSLTNFTCCPISQTEFEDAYTIAKSEPMHFVDDGNETEEFSVNEEPPIPGT